MWFYISLFLFLSLNTFAQSKSELNEFAHSKPWLRLLHYQGSYVSELDGKNFFLSKNGKFNPYEELHANIEAFQNNTPTVGPLKLSPHCAFPERKRLIEEHLGLKFKTVDCPLLKEFVKKFKNPKNLSLIFSSAFPNNPASMFGHTFLKFESESESQLLDMGVNFAAYTPPNYNNLIFMYKGVFGGYPGIWSAEPYYKKVNQYINSESRDLWEYHLNFSEQETLRLIHHLWELEVNSHFDYFFIDENCSYQVLRALEAIRTDLNISDYRIYVAPGETIKSLNKVPSLVKEKSFRPSLYHQLQIKLQALDEKGKTSTLQWMQFKPNSDKRPEVLSTALTGLLYQRSKLKQDWSSKHQDWENQLLTLTAHQKQHNSQIKVPSHMYQTEPTLGHDPYALFISTGYKSTRQQEGAIGRFKLRSAYHDLYANDLGYPPFSEIQTPLLEIEFNKHNVFIHHIGVFSSTSLFPVTALNSELSWKIDIGAKTDPFTQCLTCLVPHIDYGKGYSWGGLNYRLYSLLTVKAKVHSKLRKGYDFMPGVELGALWSYKNSFKVGATYRPLYSLQYKKMTHNLNITYSFNKIKNHELRSRLEVQKMSKNVNTDSKEFLLQYIYYFR